MRKVLIRNSVTGVAQQVMSMGLLFLAVPLFIKDLGAERYGIFSLVSVVGNLNSFAGLGLNTALTKFISEQGKCDESDLDLAVTLVLQTVILVPISLIVIVFGRFFVIDLLGVPPQQYIEVRFLFVALIIANALLMMGQSLSGVLDAMQRIDLRNYLQMSYNFSYWGLILLALLLRPSLDTVGIAVLIAAIVWFILSSFIVLRRYGRLELAALKRDFGRVARKQVGYGMKVYSGGLIGFFYEPFSKVLVSHFIGLTDVGFFDIALRLRGVVWSLVSKVFYPLFPLLANERDHKRIRMYVHDVEQKIFYAVLPLVAMMIFALPTLIGLWLNQNNSIIALTSVVIISFHLVMSSTVIPNYQYLLAKDLPEKTILLQLCNVVVNSFVFLLSFRWLGYYALILANVSAITVSFSLSLYYQREYLDSMIFDNASQFLKTFVVFIINIAIGVAVCSAMQASILRTALVSVLVLVITVGFYRLFRLITAEDVTRYLGRNSALSRCARYVLVAKAA